MFTVNNELYFRWLILVTQLQNEHWILLEISIDSLYLRIHFMVIYLKNTHYSLDFFHQRLLNVRIYQNQFKSLEHVIQLHAQV